MQSTAPARRLPPEMRRAQLVRVAGPLIARDGVAEFSLDEVAERGGVTRNLLKRYFPRGRIDLFVEVLEDVMPALTEQATEPRLSRARMRAANIERLLALRRPPVESEGLPLRRRAG